MTRQLAVAGCWEFTPQVFRDDRGTFAETYSLDAFVPVIGHPFQVAQVNTSTSRLGTLRGLHYSIAPEGQAKYVTCVVGEILDVVVDVRVDSSTFGQVDALHLEAESRSAVYIAAGVGHAFLALSDGATVSYLCSSPYDPRHELTISPLDPELDLPWPAELAPYVLSPRDAAAPSLAQRRAAGELPGA